MSEWEKKIEAGTKEKPAEEQPKEEEVKKKKDSLGVRKSRIKLKGAKSPFSSRFIYYSSISVRFIWTGA